MINVTIDGKTIEVPEGTTVLRAATMAGSFIPTLCDHPELTPYGGCRLCLVEVEGARTLQPSCTLPCSPNMVVRTDTPKIREARKFVLTLIFSERNHFCMYCQVSNGDCELQNSAYREGMTHWPLQPNWQPYAVDASHPYFVLDNNRCILCRRCVRACGELVGAFTLGFEERGAKSFLVADLGAPLGESTCVSCGTCLQVCPTGALIDRQSAYRGKETQVEHHQSVCAGCSIGCGVDVLTRDNRMVRIEGDWAAVVNDGVLCKVGRFEPLEDDRQRIVTPMVRKNGALKAATWEEAMSAIASQIGPLAGKNGSGVAALASTRLTVEALATFKQIFGDRLHSDMVTSLEEGAYTAASSTVAAELGRPFEIKLDAIDRADATLMVGVDLANEHEVAGFFVRRGLPRGMQLVIVDGEKNEFEAYAAASLKAGKAGTAAVAAGLTAAVVELGLAKAETKIPGLAGFVNLTGISREDFLAAAKILASAERPVIVYGKGVTAEGLRALVELARVCGAGLAGTRGDANSMAAALLGLEKPFALGSHQAVFVALGDDKPSQRLVSALENAPFVAVQAAYTSQLTASADVVLPVEMWAEQEGHFISADGHVQKAVRALTPVEDVRSNQAVLAELARRLGCEVSETWQEQICQRIPAATIE